MGTLSFSWFQQQVFVLLAEYISFVFEQVINHLIQVEVLNLKTTGVDLNHVSRIISLFDNCFGNWLSLNPLIFIINHSWVIFPVVWICSAPAFSFTLLTFFVFFVVALLGAFVSIYSFDALHWRFAEVICEQLEVKSGWHQNQFELQSVESTFRK